MSQAEILAAIREMSPSERIALVETVLQMTRLDLAVVPSSAQEDQQMLAAAMALREDYAHDQELTSLSVLDGDDFYAEE